MHVALLLAAAYFSIATSPSPEPTQYLVEMMLRDGGAVVGNPRLRVAAAREAQVEIRGADGDGYSIRFVATPRPQDEVHFVADVAVTSDGLLHRANPVINVKLGAPSAIEYQAIGMAQSFRVEFKINRVAE